MNERQRIHIGMMNSYNVLTGKARLIEVIESAIPIFAHVVDKPIRLQDIHLMKMYFEEIEEYEKCIELSCLVQSLFDQDGNLKKIHSCECDMPLMPRYDDKMICQTCNKYIVYEQNYGEDFRVL